MAGESPRAFCRTSSRVCSAAGRSLVRVSRTARRMAVIIFRIWRINMSSRSMALT